MRIGSGFAKGMALTAPAGLATRPTSAKVRGSILNMLQPRLEEALVLDIYAGSGALGIEAVSRGAAGAVFVEKASGALTALRRNLDELKRRAAADEVTVRPLAVVARDAVTAVPTLASYGLFDVIFADPPYREALAAFQALAGPLAGVSGPDAVWMLETDCASGAGLERLLPEAAGGAWEIVKQRAHGDTMVTILEKRGPADQRGGDGDERLT